MKHIIYAISIFVLFNACKIRNSGETSPINSNSNVSDTALSPSNSAQIPQVPTLSLANLSVGTDDIIVSQQTVGSNSGITSLYINYNTIAADSTGVTPDSLDPSSVFPVWKICMQDGSQCTNNGQWTQSYSFKVDNIIDIPTGANIATVKLCVADPLFLNASDRSSAVNECTSAAPCYCGNTVTVPFTNTFVSSQLKDSVKTSNNLLVQARQKMLFLAQNYFHNAQTYVSQCASSDSSSTDTNIQLSLQYAENVSHIAPTTIALDGETLASTMSQLLQALNSSNSNDSKSLQLAGETTSTSTNLSITHKSESNFYT